MATGIETPPFSATRTTGKPAPETSDVSGGLAPGAEPVSNASAPPAIDPLESGTAGVPAPGCAPGPVAPAPRSPSAPKPVVFGTPSAPVPPGAAPGIAAGLPPGRPASAGEAPSSSLNASEASRPSTSRAVISTFSTPEVPSGGVPWNSPVTELNCTHVGSGSPVTCRASSLTIADGSV